MTGRAELRAAFRATRAAVAGAMPAAERLRLERELRLRLLPALARASTVAVYAPMPAEIDPGTFRADDFRVAWPRVSAVTGLLAFHLCDRAQLTPGHAGIMEPPVTAPLADPDLLLVPLVAADLHGTRLGQGGGHYDRALNALRARRQVHAVGLAWECQIADRLPRAPWDEVLDAIATPHRWIIPTG